MDDNENKKRNEAQPDEAQASEAQPDEIQIDEALPDDALDAVAGGEIRIPKYVIPDYV